MAAPAPQLIIMPPPDAGAALTDNSLLALYGREEQLQALAAALDLEDPGEDRDKLVGEISAQLAANIDHRDRVAAFFRQLDNQVAHHEAEIARLERRKGLIVEIRDHMEGLLVSVLRKLGRDPKDKKGRRWLKLEGRTSVLTLKNLPASVEIEDESKVPGAYTRTTITLPTKLWEDILDSLPLDVAAQVSAASKPKVDCPKTAIKEAIEAGTIVPGARLDSDRVKLERD